MSVSSKDVGQVEDNVEPTGNVGQHLAKVLLKICNKSTNSETINAM